MQLRFLKVKTWSNNAFNFCFVFQGTATWKRRMMSMRRVSGAAWEASGSGRWLQGGEWQAASRGGPREAAAKSTRWPNQNYVRYCFSFLFFIFIVVSQVYLYLFCLIIDFNSKMPRHGTIAQRSYGPLPPNLPSIRPPPPPHVKWKKVTCVFSISQGKWVLLAQGRFSQEDFPKKAREIANSYALICISFRCIRRVQNGGKASIPWN